MARTNLRHDDSFDDAFDEDGVLKDGHVARVRMTMRDSMSDLQRSILSDAAVSDAAATRDAVAHSFGLRDGLSLSRPGFRYNTSDAAEANRERLYDSYQSDMSQRWRGASDNEGQSEGAQCTCKGSEFPESFGAPGHIKNGVCVPDDRRDDSRSDSRRDDSGSNNESHQSRMEKLYAARDADLSEAWRARS